MEAGGIFLTGGIFLIGEIFFHDRKVLTSQKQRKKGV